MFSALRRRATYANVAMTLALVFAMTGGAYAAKKYLITSTKQISPSVLKRLVGKAGPAGANGKDGAPGAQGPAGANGKDGANGAEGKEGPQGPKGEAGATGPAGAKGLNGVNGTNGATGPAGPTGPAGGTGPKGATGEIDTQGPLPVGKTETGGWAVGTVEVPKSKGFELSGVRAVASFPIPLAGVLSAAQTHVVNTAKEEFIAPGKFVPATVCLGTLAAPTAPTGNLCVYFGPLSHVNAGFPAPLIQKLVATSVINFPGASTTGALLTLTAEEAAEGEEGLALLTPVSGWGSWAVTG